MQRFSAGIRVITALLCTLLLLTGDARPGSAAIAVLLGYGLWSAYVLWADANGHPLQHSWMRYLIDVAWADVLLHLVPAAGSMMIVTLVQPVVLTSIGYGVRSGLALALLAVLGIVIGLGRSMAEIEAQMRGNLLPALSVMALAPAAALLSKPMSLLRQRLALIGEVEAEIDPRRGLALVAAAVVDSLRRHTGAEVAALVLPSTAGAPAFLATVEDGSFSAGAEVHRQIEALLRGLPACPVSHVRRRRLWLRPNTRVHGAGSITAAHPRQLEALATLLEVRTLIVAPLTRYQRGHGHLLLGHRGPGRHAHHAVAVGLAAPELLRVVETASLVDRAQEDGSALERARIGRDLHDTAIQPYLGLKFAVESVAMRMKPDNPAHGDVSALLDLVDSEIGELREMISGMRNGEQHGDNALVPAVRRQLRRFSLLFGLDVHLDAPDHIRVSRAHAGALFQMVSEALNNVRRHTPAREVWVTIQRLKDAIRLTVRDDAGSVRGKPMPGFRPASLSERASEMGGTLTCTQPDGLNTQITIDIPT